VKIYTRIGLCLTALLLVLIIAPACIDTVPCVADIADQEREIHNLINAERADRGLPSVKWSNRMYRLAEDQSSQMAQQDRLFHSSRYALEGGENVWYGEGHSWSPQEIVSS